MSANIIKLHQERHIQMSLRWSFVWLELPGYKDVSPAGFLKIVRAFCPSSIAGLRVDVVRGYNFDSSFHTRKASVTPQACASQPRWVCGASPSRISGIWPRQPSFINCSMLPR